MKNNQQSKFWNSFAGKYDTFIARYAKDTYEKSLRLIKKELNRGEIVGMFPEGTRTKDGQLRRFHTGAARLCIEYGIPYIPVGIRNSFKLEVGRKVEVHIGKPQYPDPSWKLNYENAKKFTEMMRKDIKIKISFFILLNHFF